MQGLVAAEQGCALLAADTRTQSKSNPWMPIEPQLSKVAPNPNVVTVSTDALGAPTVVVVPAEGKFSQWSYS